MDADAVLDSAEKKDRGEMCKRGSYDNDGAGYLSFSDDSDWENKQNTPQKTTKKMRKKKRGAGKGPKKGELFCFVLLYYDILLLLFTLKQYTNY